MLVVPSRNLQEIDVMFCIFWKSEFVKLRFYVQKNKPVAEIIGIRGRVEIRKREECMVESMKLRN